MPGLLANIMRLDFDLSTRDGAIWSQTFSSKPTCRFGFGII
jgi:hypothetical protein